MSSWHYIVLLLTTRWLYWGYVWHLQNVKPTWCMTVNAMLALHSTALDYQIPVLGVHLTVHCILNCMLQNVMMTLHSTACAHQMPLLGVELKPSKWHGTYAAVPLASHSISNTMFQNPMPKPSCQKSRKAIITQKVLVTQSSNIVHCNWHTQKPICVDFASLFKHFFPVQIDVFILCFIRVSYANSQKFHILLILTWKNALKWLERHIVRVQGMLNPMVQVNSSLMW